MNRSTASKPKTGWRSLPRNVWAVSLTSFFMDISSEMVINILPLFLSNVLGVGAGVIGLIEGIAEATASLLKVFSGWLSDRLRARKWLAVVGYGHLGPVQALLLLCQLLAGGGRRALGRPGGQGHPHRAPRRAGGRQHRRKPTGAGLWLPPGCRHGRGRRRAAHRPGCGLGGAGGFGGAWAAHLPDRRAGQPGAGRAGRALAGPGRQGRAGDIRQARAAGHHASEGWASHSWSSWSSSACSTWATRRTPSWSCAPRSED